MVRVRGPARAIAVTIVAVLLLMGVSACWGKRELEDRSFVTLMGVDRAETGGLLVTAVVAVPRAAGGKMGGTGGGGGGGTSSFTLSGEGKDILEAIDKLEITSSRDLTTTHMAFVILGEELAKSDVSPVVDLFSRNLEFRHNTQVAVCQGRAVDFLNDFSSPEEAEPSQYITKLVETSYSTLGVCPIVTMHDFMVGYNVIAVEPWAPYLQLTEPVPAERAQSDQAGQQSGSGGAGGGAGGAEGSPPAKPKVVGVLGTAIFRKVGSAQRMVGYLDIEETLGALILNGTLQDGYIDIANPGDQTESTVHLHHESTQVKLLLSDHSAEADFAIRLTASMDESQVGLELDEAQQQYREAVVRTTQDQLLALLSRTFLKLADLGSDVLGLGHEAEGKFKTYQDWEAYGWRDVFPRTEATFDVKLHILTYGFTIRRPYPE